MKPSKSNIWSSQLGFILCWCCCRTWKYTSISIFVAKSGGSGFLFFVTCFFNPSFSTHVAELVGRKFGGDSWFIIKKLSPNKNKSFYGICPTCSLFILSYSSAVGWTLLLHTSSVAGTPDSSSK